MTGGVRQRFLGHPVDDQFRLRTEFGEPKTETASHVCSGVHREVSSQCGQRAEEPQVLEDSGSKSASHLLYFGEARPCRILNQSEVSSNVLRSAVDDPLQAEKNDGQTLTHFIVQFLRNPMALCFLRGQGSCIVQASLGFQSGQHGVERLHKMPDGSVAHLRQSLSGKLQIDMLHHFDEPIQWGKARAQQ